jgi:hypothetical protein
MFDGTERFVSVVATTSRSNGSEPDSAVSACATRSIGRQVTDARALSNSEMASGFAMLYERTRPLKPLFWTRNARWPRSARPGET